MHPSYHHDRHADGFFCQEHSKTEIAEKLQELGCERLCVKMINKKGAGEPHSAPELFIGWFVLDVEDLECFEMTHLAEDDTEFEQGTVLCVTKMAVQRGEKSWFSIDADKAVTHGLQTWQELVQTEVMQVIGYG